MYIEFLPDRCYYENTPLPFRLHVYPFSYDTLFISLPLNNNYIP